MKFIRGSKQATIWMCAHGVIDVVVLNRDSLASASAAKENGRCAVWTPPRPRLSILTSIAIVRGCFCAPLCCPFLLQRPHLSPAMCVVLHRDARENVLATLKTTHYMNVRLTACRKECRYEYSVQCTFRFRITSTGNLNGRNSQISRVMSQR